MTVANFTPQPEPEPGLVFQEDEHLYFLDGRPVPSVTQILAEAGLVNWEFVSEWARERGSTVHKAIHLELTCGLDWSSIPESFHPYVSAELQAIEDLDVEVIASEVRVFSRTYGYAGTLDRIVRFRKANYLALWDTKTGPTVPAYALQTAAYTEAVHEMALPILNGERIKKRFAMRLKPDGSYSLEPFTDRSDITNFYAACRLVNWKRERGLTS